MKAIEEILDEIILWSFSIPDEIIFQSVFEILRQSKKME